MSLFDDLITYELCFPGAVTGSTEVECPRCGELLTVPVNDPMGAGESTISRRNYVVKMVRVNPFVKPLESSL